MEERRLVIYVDEPYIHSSHTTPNSRYDSTGGSTRAPTSRASGLIIGHAGDEAGFNQDAVLVNKSSARTGDYQREMNSDIFRKCLHEKLVPNLPSRCVVVLDNVSYQPYSHLQLDRERHVRLTKPAKYTIQSSYARSRSVRNCKYVLIGLNSNVTKLIHSSKNMDFLYYVCRRIVQN